MGDALSQTHYYPERVSTSLAGQGLARRSLNLLYPSPSISSTLFGKRERNGNCQLRIHNYFYKSGFFFPLGADHLASVRNLKGGWRHLPHVPVECI